MTDERDLPALARTIVDSNRYMALGTADEHGVPWVSPVWYAHADHREFFWVSDPEARHSRNVVTRPQVSIVIFDSHVPGGWKSVYLSARAEELADAELERGIEIFSRRSTEQDLPVWTRDDVRPPAHKRLYRARTSERWVLSPRDQRVPVALD
jgi:nitroimidazol reductase NimA-like FMN-containing flavoprotein (pyridoxamine 5'-phosphate oxidase superfamily)